MVTDDRAFYKKNKDTKLVLADKLRHDLKGVPNEFRIFPSLSDLLLEIKESVQVDSASLIAAYLNLQSETMEAMAGKHSFALDGSSIDKLNVFVTEKPKFLYVTFIIKLACSDTTNEGRKGAKILASGEGTYDTEKCEFVELKNRGEQLLYQLQDGTEEKLENIVIALGSIVIGHRTVKHSVKYEVWGNSYE